MQGGSSVPVRLDLLCPSPIVEAVVQMQGPGVTLPIAIPLPRISLELPLPSEAHHHRCSFRQKRRVQRTRAN